MASHNTLERYSGIPHVGGVFLLDVLRKSMYAEGRMVLDFGRMDPTEFKKVISVIRHGFTTSRGALAMAVIRALESWPAAPRIHEIGYLGKREMRVLVARQKAEQYRTDLIAAGHMMDVDLSEAACLGSLDSQELRWLMVDSYRVAVAGQKDVSSGSSWGQRSALHLRPATSKLSSLIKSWTLETYHMRAPLVDYLNTKPVLEWSLSSTD